ncbi:MAG: hypothetical protein AB7O32_17985 [Vicinamibacterales bacterium]
MQCRQCGTEIADKALICYRCGAATTDAKYKPVPIKSGPASGTLITLVVLLVFLLASLYITFTATDPVVRGAAGALAALCVVAAVLRGVSRQ